MKNKDKVLTEVKKIQKLLDIAIFHNGTPLRYFFERAAAPDRRARQKRARLSDFSPPFFARARVNC
ncbi:MAG: hypothetical protein IKS14_00370 [Thermoguttaceae bacterium]|nr:hypothetical protein [Thermoguttaceae bacterium]